ncbi:hypothetical protein [Nesterenkonia sphaerica]|uniref:Uncharacterized protein n=1 Tax=Nesterenkonia sphaerica TaxID=1804988 RepID=A0A5R9A4W1_9MICC|nr:hypothetical protein [Nesterenkonia sphaerica]TLP72957.1 hypothetical protein FEF27_11045 [Nesterenkonia sphaerica]
MSRQQQDRNRGGHNVVFTAGTRPGCREAEVIRAYWIRGLGFDENFMPRFHLGVEVRCPWCARTHTHGVSLKSRREHRIAHCAGRYADTHGTQEYYIVGIEHVEIPPDPRLRITELRRLNGDPLAGFSRSERERARQIMERGNAA